MTSSNNYQFVEAAAAIQSKIQSEIDLFIVAGSGFRESLPELQGTVAFSMSEIPYLPSPKVVGHGAELRFGHYASLRILVATGRVHLYEGYDAGKVAFAVRAASQLKCRGVILTNAAGSVDDQFKPGSLTVIKDQLNLTGSNCESSGSPGKVQFTDMNHCYDPEWLNSFNQSQHLRESIYAGLTGPSYETTAEARMLRILGANTVGMSTVQECIAARALSMKVLGISLVTNMAGGLGGPVNHADVLATAASQKFAANRALKAAIEAFR